MVPKTWQLAHTALNKGQGAYDIDKRGKYYVLHFMNNLMRGHVILHEIFYIFVRNVGALVKI